MNVLRSGCTLYIRDRAGPHLWVVLSDPIPPLQEVALVMLVTKKKTSDETVVLQHGDHPFVSRETSVSYGTLRFERVQGLVDKMHKGRCELRTSVSDGVLDRIRAGVFVSPHTVYVHRDRCEGLFGTK